MAKHVMSFTYQEKIPGVIDGSIRQTIRPEPIPSPNKPYKRPIAVGDTILFHGWEGTPYRTPWSFRKAVTVTEVIPITVFSKGIMFREDGRFELWDSEIVNDLSRRDGIVPPTGEALYEVLYRLNRSTMRELGVDFLRMRILRW